MAEITCKACRSAPVAAESLCLVCLRDKLAADKERRRLDERRQRRERHKDGRRGVGWDRVLKAVAVLLMLVPLMTPPLHAERILTEGRFDCAAWVKERGRGGNGTLLLQAYAIGTLNGLALGSRIEFWKAQGTRISQEQAFLWLDNWCRNNPLSTVTSGAMVLFDIHTAGERLVGKR